MYGSWDMEWDRKNYYCLFRPFFGLLQTPPGDIIILHICTKNDDHMMYGSWDMEHDRQNFLSSRSFLPFYPYMDPKNQNLKKWKNTGKYYHFKKLYHKWQSYDIWFLRYGMQLTTFFVILDCFLPFYPLTTQKTKILHRCTITENYMMYGSWDTEHDAQNFCHFRPFFALLLQGSN